MFRSGRPKVFPSKISPLHAFLTFLEEEGQVGYQIECHKYERRPQPAGSARNSIFKMTVADTCGFRPRTGTGDKMQIFNGSDSQRSGFAEGFIARPHSRSESIRSTFPCRHRQGVLVPYRNQLPGPISESNRKAERWMSDRLDAHGTRELPVLEDRLHKQV